MKERHLPYTAYLSRTIKWIIANAVFGLAPLLFMWLVSLLSEGKAGASECVHLIKDGAVLFVCCSIMGSVVIDFKLAGFDLVGWQFIAVFLAPIAILGILLLTYLLIYFKAVNNEMFNLNSRTSILVMTLSVIYCILAKTNLYMREDIHHGKH
jgi:hypothetical protein